MKWYVVVEAVYREYPPKLQQRVSRMQRSNDNTWDFTLIDVHLKENTYGHARIFSREDAARKQYDRTVGVKWPGSSIYLIFASALTRKGAAQKALGQLAHSYERGELLAEHHWNMDRLGTSQSEAKNGNP